MSRLFPKGRATPEQWRLMVSTEDALYKNALYVSVETADLAEVLHGLDDVTEVERLEDEVSTLNGDIDCLNFTIANLEEEVNELQSKLAKYKKFYEDVLDLTLSPL